MPASAPASVTVADLEVDAAALDPARAAARFAEHGCLVVRGLLRAHVADVVADIAAAAERALRLLPRAERIVEGWTTPDGALFLPAPAGFARDRQIMLLPVDYRTSGALLRSALEPRLVDLVSAILGPDVELFLDGQIVYKEPVGGHPKHLHQDSSYFQHRFQGPVAALCYGVDTTLANGALHVVPGSHRGGLLPHVDTFSHLGLDPVAWPWSRALPVEGRAGDVVLFHVDTIHGSRENRSTAPRPVFIHRYRRADDYVVVNATTTANRADAERRAPPAAKPAAQRGMMVRGRRDFAADDAPLLDAHAPRA